MAKVVLTQRADSGYDDETGEWYHFPGRYYRAAKEAEGDGCLYYEPRRASGRLVYWASARIADVAPDPVMRDHYYARIVDFLPFAQPVALRRHDGRFWESSLERGDGQPSKGMMGWSIRTIPEHEFDLILKAGYAPALGLENTTERSVYDEGAVRPGLHENQDTYERPVIEYLSSRPFRDRVFSAQVRKAYESRCAVTGLKIINGGGRAEIEAAHIRPVAHEGSDSVRNGIALSRTVHWMFDRGLISIDDDMRLLTADRLLPDGVDRLFDRSGYVTAPDDARARPNPAFLRWHRDNRFKG
jgi:putative restriction endonuclease